VDATADRPTFWTRDEAAALLRISTRSLDKLIRARKLAAVRPVPGRVLVAKEALEQFIKESTAR
jgi:excisionase family DNA binding protein